MRGANSKPSRAAVAMSTLGVAVGVGVAGLRIQLGVVFHQPVEHEGGFPQPARDRLLVEPQAVVGGERRWLAPEARIKYGIANRDLPFDIELIILLWRIPSPRSGV